LFFTKKPAPATRTKTITSTSTNPALVLEPVAEGVLAAPAEDPEGLAFRESSLVVAVAGFSVVDESEVVMCLV
jgi:hypothetical protein